MRITIVMGFFLPVPPAAGGATEKSWHRLSIEFARRGHEVTVISRTWPGWPNEETIEGVHHLRITGRDHARRLSRNLWRDFWWSRRASRVLPRADITIVNCIALPVWLGWFRGRVGKLVVMTGRRPKGQYRLYRKIDRVLAVSSSMREAIAFENPRMRDRAEVCGYPINWQLLASTTPRKNVDVTTIGFIGRIHREKGLDLFVDALSQLALQKDLPKWRVLIAGPSTTALGGSGEDYLASLESRLAEILSSEAVTFLPAIFEEKPLADLYREIDVFCYPSLAERGETFGVAVVEAMAAGAVPVVSGLACFREFVTSGTNGEIFDHTAPAAVQHFADRISALIQDRARRERLSLAARATAKHYDFAIFADRLLADFSTLKEPTGSH